MKTAGSRILFNPVGRVHYRNMARFADALSGWELRCILNPKLPWVAELKDCAYPHCFFERDRTPAAALDGVAAVVLFTSQPRVPPCHLIQEAARRSIPVIAVEEVYQMMLEQGWVNEYFIPVDHLLTASDYESERFRAIGVPPETVRTTGNPFRAAASEASASEEDRRKAKEELGCDPDRPVATLSLSGLNPDGETLETRQTLLSLLEGGLTREFELVVKPHPMEMDGDLVDFIKRHAPRAKIASPHAPIGRVLAGTDILFNRGNSQVTLDALDRGLPVIAVPVGRKTLFHELPDSVVADDVADIRRVLKLVGERGRELYKPVMDRYTAISAEQAVRNVAASIMEIAEKRELHKPTERMVTLALFWSWMGYPRQARRLLGSLRDAADTRVLEAADRLVSDRASRDDLAVLRDREWLSGYKDWILQSLWIRKLDASGERLSDSDIGWLEGFPPRMNRLPFLPYALLLCWCLLRSGRHERGERLAGDLYREFPFLTQAAAARSVAGSGAAPHRTLTYWRQRLHRRLKASVKEWLFETVGERPGSTGSSRR
ncbi:hypothetical protein ACFL2T_07060 [Elusimicrobiota bacterium]